ncbi:hemolysin family protein [Pseudonocardia bannensis]|uniref:HlyC/CorC family transporter n=1 Tax=Pseudonocardia bannensis TaxID=630973 RepID=A0A848DEI4_9PSEU|nr:hemolysin family protein [Pseudonocardia bannensis]NMH91022.1 HlyC/CorC family transporter [Pseudonocardia bannensis]
MSGTFLNAFLVLLFVLIGGYFAASEIALVSLRDAQVRRLAERSKRGRAVARLREDPSRFLSAVQIGVTFAGFFAASYGGATLAVELQRVLVGFGLSEGLAATVALVVVTLAVSYVSLVLGELVPKRLAMQRPEPVALFVAPVLDWVARIFRPVIWFLTVSTNAVVRLLGMDPHARTDEVSEAELRDLVGTNEELTAEERRVLTDVFTATDRVLREVMVPRTEVDFMLGAMSTHDAANYVADRPHSRYPVIGASPDDVLGVVHVRDVLTAAHRHDHGQDAPRTVAELARDALVLPGSLPLVPALARMRRAGHMAIIVDEYGGTDGIVTLEDLIEELVGDIEDEYDLRGRPSRRHSDGSIDLDGLLHRDDIKELAGIELPDGHFNTLAGFVVDRLGRAPEVGDSVTALRHRFTVTELDGRRASRLRVSRVPDEAESEETPSGSQADSR